MDSGYSCTQLGPNLRKVFFLIEIFVLVCDSNHVYAWHCFMRWVSGLDVSFAL